MTSNKTIILLLITSNILFIAISIALYFEVSMNEVGENNHHTQHMKDKYGLLLQYVTKQNSQLTFEEFLIKHDVKEANTENNYIIIDGIYFFFKNGHLSSIE